jgi:DNA-binding NtrC family response regulator
VPLLARHFLDQHNRLGTRIVSGLSAPALAALSRYTWPGNVDELRAVIDRAVMVASSDEIGLEDLAGFGKAGTWPAARTPAATAGPFTLPEDGCDLETVEKSLVLQALERSGGNQTRAAELLGIHRDHVRYRLNKWKNKN